MKYYFKAPFGVDKILENKVKRYNFQNWIFENANFVYMPITSNLINNKIINNPNLYKNLLYYNNFVDKNNNLCVTGNNCLANKYLFFKNFPKESYVPKTYTLSKFINQNID